MVGNHVGKDTSFIYPMIGNRMVSRILTVNLISLQISERSKGSCRGEEQHSAETDSY